MMTREELFELHKKTCAEALELMGKKSADYAHGDDPFKNFRRHGAFGILVRLNDKLARLESFEASGKPFAVVEESLEDTVQDILNYSILYLALRCEK